MQKLTPFLMNTHSLMQIYGKGDAPFKTVHAQNIGNKNGGKRGRQFMPMTTSYLAAWAMRHSRQIDLQGRNSFHALP